MKSKKNQDSYDIDVVKGVLILAVVAGHNTLISLGAEDFRRYLYSFHVIGFLFLPFLFPAPVFDQRAVIDRFVRYMTPFFFMYTLSAILFFSFEIKESSFLSWLADYSIGLVVGSARLVDKASGFQLFWFLPTLLSLAIMRSLLGLAPKRTQKATLIGLIILHGAIGALPLSLKNYIPFGLLIVAYVWPLALLSEFIIKASSTNKWVTWFALVVFIITSAAILFSDTSVNLAILKLYSYKEFHLLALHDANAISAFVSLVGLSRGFPLSTIWKALGKYSLEIYLFHSLIYQAILRLYQFGQVKGIVASGPPLVAGLIVLLITCAISYIIAIIGRRMAFWRIIFPRSLRDWKAN